MRLLRNKGEPIKISAWFRPDSSRKWTVVLFAQKTLNILVSFFEDIFTSEDAVFHELSASIIKYLEPFNFRDLWSEYRKGRKNLRQKKFSSLALYPSKEVSGEAKNIWTDRMKCALSFDKWHCYANVQNIELLWSYLTNTKK